MIIIELLNAITWYPNLDISMITVKFGPDHATVTSVGDVVEGVRLLPRYRQSKVISTST